MRLLLDGRALGPEMDGIGRYTSAVTSRLASARPDWSLRLLVSPGASVHVAPSPNLETAECAVPRFRPGESGGVARAAEGFSPDAMLVFSMSGPVLPGIRCHYVVHDTMVLDLPGYFGPGRLRNALSRAWFRRLMKRSMSACAGVAVPTHWVEERLLAHFPLLEGRTTVTFEGQDLFDPWSHAPSARGGFLLYVGNARAYKNTGRILEAYSMMLSRGIDQDLVMVVRRDRAFGGLESAAAALPGGRVRLLSAVTDRELRDLYSTCTAFVSPSVCEGFGLPVLEAMAAGCPVIASRGTALEEVAGDGAILVDPLDTGAIAAAMGQLATDPRTREELSARALGRASLFGWDSTADRVLGMLERTDG